MSQEGLIDKKDALPSSKTPLNKAEVSFDAVSSIDEEYFPVSQHVTLSRLNIMLIYTNKPKA